MDTEQHFVDIAGTNVLIYREGSDWFFRGADWSSHQGSHGAFATQDIATERARRYFTKDDANTLRGGLNP